MTVAELIEKLKEYDPYLPVGKWEYHLKECTGMSEETQQTDEGPRKVVALEFEV